MNETLPEVPFDAIYFGNTSHMYGPRENRALFRRMRSSLAPGGLLIVREFLEARFEEVEFVPVPGRGAHLIFARNPR